MRKNEDLPLISVIIINYNGLSKLGSLLDKCLESVLETDYKNIEIVFVDNASHDHSVEHVESKFGERLKTLKLDKNYGYAEGVNLGIKEARGDFVVPLNTDVIVEKEWLGHLVKAFFHDDEARIAFPKILMLEDPRRIASFGGEANILLVAWDRYLLDFEHKVKHDSYFDSPCFHSPGAAFMVSKELVNELGGFLYDKDFFAFFEDVDLGWRTQLLGHKIVFVPEARVYHKLGGSFGLVSPLKFYLMRRNALRSGIKNMETHIALVLLPIWLLSSIYAAYLFFKATRNSHYVVNGLKVIVNTIVNFRQSWRKHLLVNAKRDKHTKEMVFSDQLLSYKPSAFTFAMTTIINEILALINLRNLSIKRIREYPTFQLMHKVTASE